MNNENNEYVRIWAPEYTPNTSDYAALPVYSKSIRAYNEYSYFINNDGGGGNVTGLDTALFELGPNYYINSDNPNITNPSLAHLNLDLTQNTPGIHGGSHAWINYHGSGQVQTEATLQDVIDATFLAQTDPYYNINNNDNSWEQAGNMPPGSKARITYLNLPTQIFDPANIRVKAKAVHGN